MHDSQSIKNDLDRIKRHSRKLRIIAAAISCVIIVCMGLFFKHQSKMRELRKIEELERIETNNSRMAAERVKRARLAEKERERQRIIEDSIRIANMPPYSISDIHEMVRSMVPAYSWVYLWRKDNDNWIMQYTLEYDDKEHHFIQRFNPTTRKFEQAIEFSTTYYRNLTDNKGVYTRPENVRCNFTDNSVWGTLDYYEDGEYFGKYNRKGIERNCQIPPNGYGQLTMKRLRALQNAPSEWEADGYESEYDWLYDNVEDLYLFYGQ